MKIILYIAMSSDGFIADKNGGVSWLPESTDEMSEKMGYKDFLSKITTILIGSSTYEQILKFDCEWPYTGKSVYVFTSRSLEKRDGVKFVNEGVESFANNLAKKLPNDVIWLVGGSKLATSFFNCRLVDECIITVLPISLGEGIRLEVPGNMKLIDFKDLSEVGKGIFQEIYIRKN